jgi:hypothetical protein
MQATTAMAEPHVQAHEDIVADDAKLHVLVCQGPFPGQLASLDEAQLNHGVPLAQSQCTCRRLFERCETARTECMDRALMCKLQQFAMFA